VLDPALTRPGRMGRHIYFRTPTWEDRRDIFDLYLGKVSHDEELNTPPKRDELARITNGYSPAMIDQVCSMALTYAHSDGRQQFDWDDLLEAMTTVESGVAIHQPYPKHEARAIAIHEAGHAVCSHLYGENRLSTRLSIRRRGDSGGHHAVMALEERFVDWRSEEIAGLIWGLGAMAAEYVFYGQNTTGVTGDVRNATSRATLMVGFRAMGPAAIELSERIADAETREDTEARVRARFEEIGYQIMNRSPGGLDSNAFAATLLDRDKRPLIAVLLGQGFVVAYQTILQNRDATARVADELIAAGELYGDDVTALLDMVGLRKPEIDVLDEATWPTI
jgi:cell division protease FtsH